ANTRRRIPRTDDARPAGACVMLFRSEVSRFAARRAVRWFIVVILGVIALGTVTAAVQSKYKTAQFTGETCTPSGCTNFVQGQRLDDRFKLEHDLGDSLSASGIGFVLVSVILGATFIGADYAAGALTGQLVFEPRRRYVYGTKALAVAVMTGAI